jgi:hypothetical protein
MKQVRRYGAEQPVSANENSTQSHEQVDASNPGYKQPNIPAPLLSPYKPENSEVVVIDIHEQSKLSNPDTMHQARTYIRRSSSF